MLTPVATDLARQRKMSPDQQNTGAWMAKTLKIMDAP
jgi:hypothetical protein